MIALIGLRNKTTDSIIHLDAATALSYLTTDDDIKRRFLQSPEGLKSLFYLCRSPSLDVKRSAVKIFHNLSKLPETAHDLVCKGCLKYIFDFAMDSDEKLKRDSASVIKNLAAVESNQKPICDENGAIESMNILMSNQSDLTIRREIMHVVTVLASNSLCRKRLVYGGVLDSLLVHLDPNISSLETIGIVLGSINNLTKSHESLEAMIRTDLVPLVRGILFDDLKDLREYRLEHSCLKSSKTKPLKNAKLQQRKLKSKIQSPASPVQLETQVLKSGLSILLNLSFHSGFKDILIDLEIPNDLFEESLLLDSDRRVSCTVVKILINLAESNYQPSERHEKLLQAGIMYPVSLYLRGTQFELKCLAIQLVANLCQSDVIKEEFASQRDIVGATIEMANPHDEDINFFIAVIISALSESRSTFNLLVNAGAIHALTYMISPGKRNKDIWIHAAKSFCNLSEAEELKDRIVQSGSMAHIISISRSGEGLAKRYSIAAVTNLKHDVAAVRIQTVLRGYLNRKRKKICDESKYDEESKY